MKSVFLHLNPDVGDVPVLIAAAILDEGRQQLVIRQSQTDLHLKKGQTTMIQNHLCFI